MKNIFTFLLLLTCLSMNAQSWERVFPEYGNFNYYNFNEISLIENDLLMVHFSDSWGEPIDVSTSEKKFFAIDLDGNPVWEKGLMDDFEFFVPFEPSFIPYLDGYVRRKNPTIGYVDPAIHYFSSTGEVTNELDLFEGLGNQASATVSQIFILDDNSLLVVLSQTDDEDDVRDLLVFHVDQNANVLDHFQLDWLEEHLPYWVYPVELNENGNLVFAHSDESYRVFYELDANGEFVDSVQIHHGYHGGEISPDGNRFTVFDDTLRKFNPAGDLLFEIEIAPSSRVEIGPDGVFVLYYGDPPDNPFTTANAQITKLDFDGNIIYQRSYNNQNGPNEETANDLVPLPDGSFAIVGQTFTPNGQLYNSIPFVIKVDENGNLYPNAVVGNIMLDNDSDCAISDGDLPLADWLVIAENEDESFLGATNESGHYFVPTNPGTYTVTMIPPSPFWGVCENSIEVDFPGTYLQDTINFLVDQEVDCPAMVASGAAWTLRPCFERPYNVSYCNYGTVTAENAYLEITFDEEITPASSTLPWTTVDGQTYTFELGDLEPLECGEFSMQLFLDCEAEMGAAFCVELLAYPNELCGLLPSWEGAFLEVSGTCEDDVINFKIENIGDGNMDGSEGFVIIEDAVLFMQGDVELNSGDFEDIPVTAAGSTYTIIADQVPLAPGPVMPTLSVEGCGENTNGGISIGFVNQFTFNELYPYLDQDCPIAVNAYDPNDKRGFPLGFSDQHYIEPNTNIEYIVRFQNTGTDTAYQVVLRDTLSQWLDLSTLKIGAASHPFEWSVVGNELEFAFRNIQLPDSLSNPVESQGFVEFSINAHPDAPNGTEINNSASIYFDFNPPILTNRTSHIIYENFIDVVVGTTTDPLSEDASVSVMPNPFVKELTFKIEHTVKQDFVLEVFDVSGQRIFAQQFSDPVFRLENPIISNGIYFYQITGSKGFSNSGKLIKQ